MYLNEHHQKVVAATHKDGKMNVDKITFSSKTLRQFSYFGYSLVE